MTLEQTLFPIFGVEWYPPSPIHLRLETQNGILFGNRVFADVIREGAEMSSSWELISVLIRDRRGDADTEEKSGEDGGCDGRDEATRDPWKPRSWKR